MEKNIFAKQISGKGIVSKNITKSSKDSDKKTNKQAKTSNTVLKKMSRWQIGT